MRAVWLTMAALMAFSANSLLCRLALGTGAIDPVWFTVIRIGSGALVLSLFTAQHADPAPGPVQARPWARWLGGVWLWVYALPFSLAYTRLEAGTGALLLFGAVQLSLFGVALYRREWPSPREWLGWLGACVGLTYLLAPGLQAPDPLAAASMVLAGIGWALYTIEGKRSGNPQQATARHFRRAALLTVPVGMLLLPVRFWGAAEGGLGLAWGRTLTNEGVLFAVTSGAIASALGYIAWYGALRYLTATRAALVQLSVPVGTALGGLVVLNEALSFRLVVAGGIVLGSLAFAIHRPRPRAF